MFNEGKFKDLRAAGIPNLADSAHLLYTVGKQADNVTVIRSEDECSLECKDATCQPASHIVRYEVGIGRSHCHVRGPSA